MNEKAAVKTKPWAWPDISHIMQLLREWWQHHMDGFVLSYQRIWVRPMASVMTIIVIALTLMIPLSAYIFLESSQHWLYGWRLEPQLSLFFSKQTTTENLTEIQNELISWPEVRAVELVSPEQGLVQFMENTGLSKVFDYLPENPLPPVLVVFPQEHALLEVQELQQKLLTEFSDIESIEADLYWLERLQYLFNLGMNIFWFFAIGGGLALFLVVVNTICLIIENYRAEIQLILSVGGTNKYIRRPYLYMGFWYGCFGGLLAVYLLQVFLWWMQPLINQLSSLFSQPTVVISEPIITIQDTAHVSATEPLLDPVVNSMLIPFFSATLFSAILISSLLGIVGAYWAVRQQLKHKLL